MSEPLTSTTFLATIPDIQSAIKFGGDGSVRIQLDIPESEVGGVMPLTIWTRRVLRVTVAPAGQVRAGEQARDVAEGPERQPKGRAAKEQGTDGAPRTRWLQDGTG